MTDYLHQRPTAEVLLELLRENSQNGWVSSSHVRSVLGRNISRQAVNKAANKLRRNGYPLENKSGRDGGYRLVAEQ